MNVDVSRCSTKFVLESYTERLLDGMRGLSFTSSPSSPRTSQWV